MSIPRAATSVATRCRNLAGAEAGHHLLALSLRKVARDHRRRETAPHEEVRDRADFFPRVAEDHGGCGLVVLDQLLEHHLFLHSRRDDVRVADLLDVQEVLGEKDPARLLQIVVDEPPDPERNGGREQERLPLLGNEPHDLSHLDGEAHVEHSIGLVEHEAGDFVEPERAALQEIEHPPRSPDGDVRPRLDTPHLLRD